MVAGDKERINRFSRLLTRRNDARATLARREKLLQLHEDAAEEVLMLDEGVPVQLNVGDAFFLNPKELVEARLETVQEELKGEIEGLKAQIDELSGDITGLKATLYAKFGKTINLEESTDD